MFLIDAKGEAYSQPSSGVIDRGNSFGSRVRRCINHNTPDPQIDLAERALVTGFSGGTSRNAKVATPDGVARNFFSPTSNEVTEFPSWTNITNEASALFIFYGQQGTAWELGATGTQDHFPFSNLLYTDAFWSSRWANGISLLSGDSWDGRHVVLITVKNGNQKIYHNGKLWHSNTLTSGFTFPTTFITHRRTTGNHYGVLDVLFDKFWDTGEALSLSKDPWQIFEPEIQASWVQLAAGGGLAGSATAQSTATGALTTGIPISGASASVSTASGSLTTAIPLAGSAASVSLAGGVLSTQIMLSGDAVAAAAASGALTTQIVLSGAALAQALATGDLNTSPQGLAGNAAASASGSATLTTAIPLAGAASAFSVATGGLITGIPLAGVAASVASATGDLTISITLSAQAMAQAAASGSLSTQIQLSGAAVAQALVTATLAGGILYARCAYIAKIHPRAYIAKLQTARSYEVTA